MSTKLRYLFAALVGALALAAAVAACGGSDSTDSSTSTTGSTSTAGEESGDAGVAEAEQALEVLYAGKSFKHPPGDAPAPKPNQKVWLIPFGLEAPEGADWAAAAERSAKILGWDVTTFDGKFSPDTYLTGVRQAIADNADAIVLYVIDCAPIQAGLKQARDAGIAVIAAQGADCNVEGEGEELFTASVNYTQGDFGEWGRALGIAQADWIISTTEGEAKAIEFFETDTYITVQMHEGFVEEMGKCSSCEIVETVEFLATDFGTKLTQKAEQALTKNPDANTVAVPYDGVATAGVAQAVKTSGRVSELGVIAGVGLEANIELIRNEEGQDAGYGTSVEWEGYASIDTLNRALAGEEIPNSGNGIAVFDREHGLPQEGAWQPPIDFAADYEESFEKAAAGR